MEGGSVGVGWTRGGVKRWGGGGRWREWLRGERDGLREW